MRPFEHDCWFGLQHQSKAGLAAEFRRRDLVVTALTTNPDPLRCLMPMLTMFDFVPSLGFFD